MFIKNYYDKDDSASSAKPEEQEIIDTGVEGKTDIPETKMSLLDYDDIDLDKVDEIIETQSKIVTETKEETPIEVKTDESIETEKDEEQTVKPVEEESNIEPGSKSIRVDDKYISEQPEDIQTILRPLLNKKIKDTKGKENYFEAPDYLVQNYIHAEKLIQELKSGKTEEVKEDIVEKNDVAPDINSYSHFTDDEKSVVDNLVQKELESIFPEIRDKDNDEIKDFLADLNQNDPESAHQFMQIKNDASKRYTNTLAYYKYIADNHETVVKNQLTKANELIKERVEKMYGIKDTNALLQNDRYNFTKLDENKTNNLLNALTRNGNAKSFLGKGKAAYVMYAPEVIANNFINAFAPELLQIAKAEAKRDGYQEAIERKSAIKAAPSISNAKVSVPLERAPITTNKVDYDMDFEQMDSIIEEQIKNEMKRKH